MYFGKDDAESDFAAGGLLQQGFLRTLAYDEALKGHKNLFVGRKGAGKSAICLTLKRSLEGEDRVALVTPDEISAEEIRRFSLAGITPESSKELIWRYVFSVQVAKYLLRQADKGVPRDDASRKHIVGIKKFLSDNGEIEELTASSRFWRIVEKLNGRIEFSALALKGSLEAGMKAPSSGVAATEQLKHLEEHLSGIAKLIGISGDQPSFYILVDQIEKVWSNDPESNSMVIGLLQASKSVTVTFNFVRCAVFLRTDIYERVKFQEGDKFRTDEFRIEWDKKKLIDLALVRAQASSSVELSATELWTKIFPATLDEDKIQDFLVNLTLMRPRDIIQLCNCCRYTALQNGNKSITAEDMRRAARVYSSWKLTDLQNEWIVNYPFLPDVCLLLSNRSYVFTKESFAEALKLISGDLTQRYPTFRQNLASADSILQVLYAVGLVGVIRQRQTVYNFHVAQDQSVLPTDTEFVVHPGFRTSLQTASAFGDAPVEMDAEFLRSRFRRGFSLGSVTEEYGHGGNTSILYVLRLLDDARLAVEAGGIAEDLKRELRNRVATVQEQLGQAADSFDESIMQVTASRIWRYMEQLLDRLSSNSFAADKDILYRFDQVARALRDIEYGGGRRTKVAR